MVYCIGLTGNIASGKSTIAQYFNQLGVPVINADVIAKQLTLKGTPAYNEIVAHFDHNILSAELELDRKKIRSIIFSNPQERMWLESLLHPEIRRHLAKEVSQCAAPYCLVEIPLLNDRRHYPYINRTLLVTAPVSLQINRIIARDQCTEDQALAIITTQPDVEERKKNADDILENNTNPAQLKHEVERLHKKYLILASQRIKAQ